MRSEYCFWAKKKEENGRLLWLPLTQHLEDTRNVADRLWEHWLGEGQKKLITDSLETKYETDDLGKRLVQFLAAVHDIGKATPAFQTQKGYTNSEDLNLRLLEKLEHPGFEGISSVQLKKPEQSHHSIAGQYLLYTYGVEEDISTIIGGHHGKPIDSTDDYKSQGGSYPTNYFQIQNLENKIHQKWKENQRRIFNWALELSGFTDVDELPKIKQPAQVILSGLLIMADWIASNEHYFPLITIDDTEVKNKSERTASGFRKWKKAGLWEPRVITNFKGVYEKRFGFEPKDVQTVLADTIVNTGKPGIFILEAPMGVGKTAAALVAAEQLAAKTDRNGIFFGLPTQATSNGIFPRIEKWLESIQEDLEENISIHLVHGKAQLNKDFAQLSQLSENINIDEADNGSVIVNEWFSGRKTASLDDFVVGTVDQFLMVALKQKHLALRHLGFSKKIVIIDEVHAYDAYMNQYLLEAIRWMGAYGVPVIILSATLPAERRVELLKSYMLGLGKEFNKKERKELAEVLRTDAYPLITYNDGGEVRQITDFQQDKNKMIRVKSLREAELLETVDKELFDGGVIGLVVNTVKRAQELAKTFAEKFGEDMVELLHSGFIATQRVQKEKDLLQMIGKNAQRPKRKIIIGTQVIEQSLDIDFDVLISDLAPMDLLIQRVGRLHRHDIERPVRHENSKCYVLGTSESLDFEEGSSFVYGDYLLARTQYFLPDFIHLPADISPLVQKVYDFEHDIDFDDELNVKYIESQKQYITKIEKKEAKASRYRINDPDDLDSKGSLIGWLKNPNPDESEEKAFAQVRDIEDTVEVIALKQIGDGYGIFGETEDISSDITNFQITKKVAQNTLRLPLTLSKSYNVDKTIKELEKYYRRHFENWDNSSWLKGTLGIVFDENNEFILNGFKLSYDEKYGVQVERV
ncbi:CRISPR-associated helicase/endonuclease Cas3 [Streptococcus sobrinus]|uniref:CRISPR-associated helicase/endonuclease Cas3 n=1 Tax=Streptococcus sobrinus TaxID=1310 RepID=UPI0002FE6583|nr:CRISPR-associated helicase/endonuclease Cas3 [Streptococcus sobrinus]